MTLTVYVEGGGPRATTRADLRSGLQGLFGASRLVAQQSGCSVNIVPCGSRGEAHDKFIRARRTGTERVLLLVDAERSVDNGPVQHLRRHDNWPLQGVPDDDVYLMAQLMETWLIADRDALARFYGRGFKRDALPASVNLERVSKQDVCSKLKRATKTTARGEYDKTRDAPNLLRIIDSAIVTAKCEHAKRLTDTIRRLRAAPGRR